MNSLYQQLANIKSNNINANPNIKQLFDLIKMSKDPNAALNQLLNNNPQSAELMKIIQANGGDPKSAFYALAKEKGVDPEQILRLFR